MIDLLLSEPKWSDQGDCDAARDGINILKKIESIIWSLITSEGRSEARLWLCKTISCLSSVTPQAQREVFVKLLRSKPRKLGLAEQLLQKIFEKKPRKLGAILAKRNDMIKKFFKGKPRRILQWFGNFAGVGESEHRKGARALSQFAFVNRDICWEELEWKGKHGQSPAVVATKPHYFLELDVQRTVENFLEYVPEFWSSDELAESVNVGDILLLDTTFFINCFIDLMYEDDAEDVWNVISDFLFQESFSSLCHYLLIILDERDLCYFLNLLSKFLPLKREPKHVCQPFYWVELLLSMHNGCPSIDEFLLINALINQGRQLLRLVRDEEHEEERMKLGELVLEFSSTSSVSNATLLKECLKSKKADSLKWLCFQSWVLQYRLSGEYKSPDSWETLFVRNGINFHKTSSFDLLGADGLSEESESSLDNRGSTISHRKKGKPRKKRRKYYDHNEYDKDEVFDEDALCTQQSLLSTAGNWLLSTDNFSSAWNTVDLPEHLAKHCFSTWMNWLCFNWNSQD